MNTSVEALAQSIIDLTIAGPIPGGVGENIRNLAKQIAEKPICVMCLSRETVGPANQAIDAEIDKQMAEFYKSLGSSPIGEKL